MAAITVRNLSPEVHRALKARASAHRRSAEAEVRAIIAAAVLPAADGGFGSQLRHRWQGEHSDDLVIERDRRPAEPIDLE